MKHFDNRFPPRAMERVRETHQSVRHRRNLRDRLAADSLPGGLLLGLDGFEEADALGDDGVEVGLVGRHGWEEERAGAVEEPRERRRRRAPSRDDGDGGGGGGGREEELGRCRREPPTSPTVKKLGFLASRGNLTVFFFFSFFLTYILSFFL